MIFEKILFDFDGVLCHDRFYSNLKISHPAVSKFIEKSVFGKGSDIPNKWMRAEMTADDVNKFISKNTNIDFDELSSLFIKSVKAMSLDNRLLNLAKMLSSEGRKVAIVTDNMDVFSTVTVEHHSLDQIFPVIINSFDHGIMKNDNKGRLFDIAFEKLGTSDYSDALLIDDSIKSRSIFENKGGTAFLYETFEGFEAWMKENLNPKP